MSRCPFAEWVPVPLTANQKARKITPVGLVCHTAVSNSSLLRPSGDVRWHFYLNKTGELYQFFDTGTYAPCQYDGNYWTSGGEGYGFISCESWDGAGSVWDGRTVSKLPPWTAAQMATWAKLGAWLHKEHGVTLIKATAPRGKGIGYHAQFTRTEPYKWNANHACPGPARIAQMPTVIRMMNDAVKGEDVDMTPEQAQQLADLHRNLISPGIKSLRDGKQHTAGFYLGHTDRNAFDVKAILQQKVLPALTAEQQRDAAEALVLAALQAAVVELRDGLDGDLSDADIQRLSQALVRGLVGEVTETGGN